MVINLESGVSMPVSFDLEDGLAAPAVVVDFEVISFLVVEATLSERLTQVNSACEDGCVRHSRE